MICHNSYLKSQLLHPLESVFQSPKVQYLQEFQFPILQVSTARFYRHYMRVFRELASEACQPRLQINLQEILNSYRKVYNSLGAKT